MSTRAVAGLAGTLLAVTLMPLSGALAAGPAPGAPAEQTTRQNGDIEPACSGCGYGVTATEVSRTRVNGEHVRDLSTNWAPASNYTWARPRPSPRRSPLMSASPRAAQPDSWESRDPPRAPSRCRQRFRRTPTRHRNWHSRRITTRSTRDSTGKPRE